MNTRSQLLYLGFAFPPGVSALHPSVSPAGQGFETQMVAELRKHFQIHSVGLMPFPIEQPPDRADPATGIAHDLILAEQAPEFWHRPGLLRRLKQHYHQWCKSNGCPRAVLVYNLTPVYNQFIRWLARQPRRPRLVLLLLDSSELGRKMSAWRKFRYRLKPFVIQHEKMLAEFDACIGLSTETKKYALANQLPFLWMPGACTPARAPESPLIPRLTAGPLRFGYFGALASHAGVTQMMKVFLQTPGGAELHLSGHGKLSGEMAEIAKRSPRLKYYGLLPAPEDCLRLGLSCDVMINPRPAGGGNENSVASKLFEYALCGQAIVTSRMPGIDEVLGPAAFYFEPDFFEANLRRTLDEVMATPREELQRRGRVISERIKTRFNWPAQAANMAEFILKLP